MDLTALSRQRWRIALSLSAAMFLAYFGFVLLIAFDAGFMGRLLMPGLSIGIVLGALVIGIAWVVTWIYVRWANEHFDRNVSAIRGKGGEA